jgi:hypothetical protein
MCEQKNPESTFDPDLKYRDLELARTEADFDKGIETRRWLFEKRLEYARNFFAHHAKQRMDMFNYFLLFAGLALSAFANVFKDGHYGTSTIIAMVAALLTIVFMFLDRRNEELVHISEDSLEALEFDLLFTNYNRVIDWPRRRGLLGKMHKGQSRTERPLGIFRRQTADITGILSDQSVQGDESKRQKEIWPHRKESHYAHGRWLPIFQLAVFLLFFSLAIDPWLSKIIDGCRKLIHP